MIAFIDDHRDVHGVEPICEVLPIAPSTYRAHAARRDPERGSARAKRDAGLREKIRRVFDENFASPSDKDISFRPVRPERSPL